MALRPKIINPASDEIIVAFDWPTKTNPVRISMGSPNYGHIATFTPMRDGQIRIVVDWGFSQVRVDDNAEMVGMTIDEEYNSALPVIIGRKLKGTETNYVFEMYGDVVTMFRRLYRSRGLIASKNVLDWFSEALNELRVHTMLERGGMVKDAAVNPVFTDNCHIIDRHSVAQDHFGGLPVRYDTSFNVEKRNDQILLEVDGRAMLTADETTGLCTAVICRSFITPMMEKDAEAWKISLSDTSNGVLLTGADVRTDILYQMIVRHSTPFAFPGFGEQMLNGVLGRLGDARTVYTSNMVVHSDVK